jgi:hypothetical protein
VRRSLFQSVYFNPFKHLKPMRRSFCTLFFAVTLFALALTQLACQNGSTPAPPPSRLKALQSEYQTRLSRMDSTLANLRNLLKEEQRLGESRSGNSNRIY